jgi:hypothetical protein
MLQTRMELLSTVQHLMQMGSLDCIHTTLRVIIAQVVCWWSGRALTNQCEVSGFCGLNSYCSGMGSFAECKCYPGFDFINSKNKFLGCHQNFNEDDCRRSKDPTMLYNVASLENVSWKDYPFSVITLLQLEMEKESCGKSCVEDCNCGAVLYTGDDCKKYKLPLRYGRIRNANISTTAFFKVSIGNTVFQTVPLKSGNV